MHIKPYGFRNINESSNYRTSSCEEDLSAEEDERFEYGGYVGDEIF